MKYLYLTLLFVCITLVSFSQWNSNTSLNLEVAGVNATDIQTATTTDGKTWIAFYSNNEGNYDMRAQLLDVNGTKLLGPNGMVVCAQPSGSATYVFNVCTDAANNLVIAFQYQVSGVNTAVVTKVATSGTLLWGANGITLGAGLAPYPAVLSTGETIVAWSNSSPSTLYMQKITTAGATAWATPVAVNVGTSLTTRGQIVPNLEGKFTMVFQRKGVGISTTLYAQRYANDGTPLWTAPVQISAYTASGARYYSILSENDTTYFGYYASGGSRFYSYLQRINPDGTLPYGTNGSAFSNYSTGSDPYQQTTNIAHVPGSAYVWAVCTYSNTAQSQYGVFVQKFETATGSRLFNVNGKEVYAISANSDQQAGNLALINDAPLFMSYDATYKIYATRLNATGDFVWTGNRVELSSTTAGGSTPKGRFNFTTNVNNQSVAVWYENRGTEYRPYSQNIIASGNTGPLPVTLSAFNAVKNDKTINLTWKTYSENNNKGFYVERSADGINFSNMGFVTSKALNGSSNIVLDYTLTDLNPYIAANYYRLKQTDNDGKYIYSKVLLIKYDKTGNIFINKVYPNPVVKTLQVLIESAVSAAVTYTIEDMQGKTLQQSEALLKTGQNTLTINVSSLAKGTYFLKVTGQNNKEKIVRQWIKQ